MASLFSFLFQLDITGQAHRSYIFEYIFISIFKYIKYIYKKITQDNKIHGLYSKEEKIINRTTTAIMEGGKMQEVCGP